jgi:hypothetical protein
MEIVPNFPTYTTWTWCSHKQQLCWCKVWYSDSGSDIMNLEHIVLSIVNLEHIVLSKFYSNACLWSPYFYIVTDLIFGWFWWTLPCVCIYGW